MSIIIRKVLPEEANDYTACHINCWQATYKGIVPDDFLTNMLDEIEERTERCKKSLQEPGDYEFYCVIYDNKMIGRLIISKSKDEDKPDAGDICAIYLLKDFWDKGYGREMMDFAITKLKRLGYKEVIIWVLEDNHRARKFYEKCGFTLDGGSKELDYGKTFTVVRYSKII